MTAYTAARMITLAAAITALAGCSNTGPSIATGTLPLEKAPVTTARVDPQCVSLANQIDGLRAEGSVDRLEKAATTGKSSNVQVKRATLAKQAELNRVNAEFQAKCGPSIPRAQSASTTPSASTIPPATTASSAPVQPKATASTSAATASTSAATASTAPPAAPGY